ncbi:hypothetical protein A4G28_04425 [Mycobacterium ostraviense]|uniref:Glycosyltransferase n=2 Tax=Mycobacterium ostraviense TaxID=2738409 RepID=A0A162D5Y6_9MYCO|nr:hypothetical protein A4G28_04425 [Mycobacterium ostraviense]
MVVDCPSLKPLPIRRDWFPGSMWVHGLPSLRDCEQFCRDVDVILSAETMYGSHLPTVAKQMGVKTVLACNYEFLNRQDEPTLWAAPSKWHWDDIPNPKVHLPVPVEVDRFTPQVAARASRFLHVVGRPAVHDRAGTADLLLALENVYTDITVTITCQEPNYVRGIITAHNIHLPDNIDLRVCEGDVPDYADLYDAQHVMIYPRRFGGLSLPMQEACAAGIPVIAPAISPQLDWLPREWLVSASKVGDFRAKQRVDLYTVDHLALAEKILRFANYPVFYREAAERAVSIAKSLSWEQLRPLYEKVLSA